MSENKDEMAKIYDGRQSPEFYDHIEHDDEAISLYPIEFEDGFAMSIQYGKGSYSQPRHYFERKHHTHYLKFELAFFNPNGDFLQPAFVPECVREYAEPGGGETQVFPYVPEEVVEKAFQKFKEKHGEVVGLLKDRETK